MTVFIGDPAVPIARMYLGEIPISRWIYNGTTVYQIADVTLTQPWEGTGFLSVPWTLGEGFTAFVFMRGQFGAVGSDWTPRNPTSSELQNATGTGGIVTLLTYDNNIGNVSTTWGILHATTPRQFHIVVTPGGVAQPGGVPHLTFQSGTPDFRLGTGGRGGNGYSILEGTVSRGNVYGTQGRAGTGWRSTIGHQQPGSAGGVPGAPFPPVSLPNDLSTTCPDFTSTPFPANFLTDSPPQAAVTIVTRYEPEITA